MSGLGLPELLLIAIGAIWVTAFLDCMRHERDQTRLIWAIAIIFLNVLGALLYLAVRTVPRRLGYQPLG